MNYVTINGSKYISTVRAAVIADYSKDYVGQLCRDKKLKCKRVSGHWYVKEASLTKYKEGDVLIEEQEDNAVTKDVATNQSTVGNVVDDIFSYDGVAYIATTRAADISGYNQDYIGQLARSGDIAARKVGRRWFIGKDSLLLHKKRNDELLAEVQSKASGVRQQLTEKNTYNTKNDIAIHHDVKTDRSNFNVRYISESNETPFVPFEESLSSTKKTIKPQSAYSRGDILAQTGESIHTIDTRNMLQNKQMFSFDGMESKNVIDLHQTPAYEHSYEFEDDRRELQDNSTDVFIPTEAQRTGRFRRILKLMIGIVIVGIILSAVVVIVSDINVFSKYTSFSFSDSSHLISRFIDAYANIVPGTTLEYSATQ